MGGEWDVDGVEGGWGGGVSVDTRRTSEESLRTVCHVCSTVLALSGVASHALGVARGMEDELCSAIRDTQKRKQETS